MALGGPELEQLRRARQLLESPSLAVRFTDLVGRPLEKSIRLLPEGAVRTIHLVVRQTLERALDFALATMGSETAEVSSDSWHKWASATTGAVGGFFGVAGLAVELPATTLIMLRSIGDIARSEGHDLGDSATRIACLEVFALGGRSRIDDAAETGYYAVRAVLSKVVSDAARHVAEKGVAGRGAPVLVRLIEAIAARFGIVVQEKVAMELLPVVGAVSGALINTVFIGHFQSTARGHFIVRRLERLHGIEAVRAAYESL